MKTITLCLNAINLHVLSRKAILFLVISFSLIACSSDDEASSVSLQVKNISSLDYEDLRINLSTPNTSARVNLDFLASGEASEIKIFLEIFPFPQAELKLNEQTLVWHGYTTNQDAPLTVGHFDCLIDVVENSRGEPTLLILLERLE